VLNVHQALSNGATRLWVFSSDVLDFLVITQPTKVLGVAANRAYAPTGVLTPGWAFSFGSPTEIRSHPVVNKPRDQVAETVFERQSAF